MILIMDGGFGPLYFNAELFVDLFKLRWVVAFVDC